MAYKQFTFKKLEDQFGLKKSFEPLFFDIQHVEPSSWLLESFARSKTLSWVSEKSRSETIVSPILLELKTNNQGRFAIYSGVNMEADKRQGLNGEVDFVLSNRPQSLELDTPVFCLLEAKDNDLEMRIPQCIAQMIGARMLDQADGFPIETIYGCVTTGQEWQFLKLEGSTVYIDDKRYFINQLSEILGVLQQIIDYYLPKN